jgi:hypothetical protein
MVCFQTKNPDFGRFLRALDRIMLIFFMAICNILWTFGIFYDHLVQFVFICYIFSSHGIMHQKKSGNPGEDPLFTRSCTYTVCKVCSRLGVQVDTKG